MSSWGILFWIMHISSVSLRLKKPKDTRCRSNVLWSEFRVHCVHGSTGFFLSTMMLCSCTFQVSGCENLQQILTQPEHVPKLRVFTDSSDWPIHASHSVGHTWITAIYESAEQTELFKLWETVLYFITLMTFRRETSTVCCLMHIWHHVIFLCWFMFWGCHSGSFFYILV